MLRKIKNLLNQGAERNVITEGKERLIRDKQTLEVLKRVYGGRPLTDEDLKIGYGDEWPRVQREIEEIKALLPQLAQDMVQGLGPIVEELQKTSGKAGARIYKKR